MLAKSSTDPFSLRSDGHMLISGSLTSMATNKASEDEACSNCTEKYVKICVQKKMQQSLLTNGAHFLII